MEFDMAAQKKVATGKAATTPSQDVTESKQNDVVDEQKDNVDKQEVTELNAGDDVAAEAQKAAAVSDTVSLRAVYPLAVRHPDKTHADGRPWMFSMYEAMTLPASTIDPEAPDRDQWIIDTIKAGYLIRTDA